MRRGWPASTGGRLRFVARTCLLSRTGRWGLPSLLRAQTYTARVRAGTAASALLLLSAVAMPAPAAARVLPARDAAGFTAALAQARPGDTIRLAGVAFAPLEVRRHEFAGTVHVA